ncbi:hypothetical protein LTR64_004881 [Lithohypha guttulata]|uniref:uncharacterized protein n=1 Tax=Lithohypha guttulata TaxID=1690604 RepID=UPI00315DC6F0
MPASDLHSALLRPAVMQILKAAGFNLAKPSVVDTVADLAARYLLVLASEAVQSAKYTHGDNELTIQDIRMALQKVGALRPQLSATEEATRETEFVNGVLVPFEDLRGVDNFIEWAHGPVCKEIRRVAGLDGGEFDNVADLAAGMDENEDYVTAIKKKHSKTAEESRFEGTMLGRDADLQPVSIAGGPIGSLSQWNAARMQAAASAHGAQSVSSAVSSALSTPIDSATPEHV